MQSSKDAEARARFNSRSQSQPVRPVRHQTPDVRRSNNEEQQKQLNIANKKIISETRDGPNKKILSEMRDGSNKKTLSEMRDGSNKKTLSEMRDGPNKKILAEMRDGPNKKILSEMCDGPKKILSEIRDGPNKKILSEMRDGPNKKILAEIRDGQNKKILAEIRDGPSKKLLGEMRDGPSKKILGEMRESFFNMVLCNKKKCSTKTMKSEMGHTLSEPVTVKNTSSCENHYVKVGSSCMQGWRINMEDAHTHLLTLPTDKDSCYFGVFDGHGGAKVAQYAGNNLHKRIINNDYYGRGNIAEALRHGFLHLDTEMQKDEAMKDELAGTTALVVLLKNNRIFCGNVGDSRAVASVAGRVDALSFDHKPSNDNETRRIVAAGGWVELNRVNGNLALSRALGDFVFKKNDKKKPEEQIVTAFPDVIEKEINPDYEFVILACDGIWDVLENEDVVKFIRARIAQKMQPETICEELMTACLAPDCNMGGLGCDNMTVVLVCFLHGGTYEDLAKKCSRPASHTISAIHNDNSLNSLDLK